MSTPRVNFSPIKFTPEVNKLKIKRIATLVNSITICRRIESSKLYRFFYVVYNTGNIHFHVPLNSTEISTLILVTARVQNDTTKKIINCIGTVSFTFFKLFDFTVNFLQHLTVILLNLILLRFKMFLIFCVVIRIY